MPRVTVIIPTYNAELFIAQALDTVFAQTFLDFEVIVIDDGSTDNTVGIVSRYQPRARLLKQSHKGAAAARNYGIRESSGDIIAFLDADDLWRPRKLEEQVEAFDRRPELGMVMTENSFFDADGVIKERSGKYNRLMRGNIVRNIFLRSGVATPTVAVRKSVFEHLGYFEEDLLIAEDDNMWLRIATHYPIELVDEPLVEIRSRPDSTCRNLELMYECIERSVQILSTKYPQVWETLQEVLPEKRAQIHFSKGYLHFSNSDYRQARAEFRAGIRSHFRCWRNLQYLMASYLPVKVIKLVRRLKRRIVGLHSPFPDTSADEGK